MLLMSPFWAGDTGKYKIAISFRQFNMEHGRMEPKKKHCLLHRLREGEKNTATRKISNINNKLHNIFIASLSWVKKAYHAVFMDSNSQQVPHKASYDKKTINKRLKLLPVNVDRYEFLIASIKSDSISDIRGDAHNSCSALCYKCYLEWLMNNLLLPK